MLSVIKTEHDYKQALEKIKILMDSSLEGKSTKRNELEVLALLLEDYEKKHYEISSPDPIDALLFRMDQQNLTRKDLEPYIGTRSKVSEILSRKTPLTLPIIKALHNWLKIPAEILLQEYNLESEGEETIDWSHYPIIEMFNRDWIESKDINSPDAIAYLEAFMCPVIDNAGYATQFRKTQSLRSARATDQHALQAWIARVWQKAESIEEDIPEYNGSLNAESLRELAKLSRDENGLQIVIDELRAIGIRVICERHLGRTYLDGASIFFEPERPVIGLSLRYDRLNNFWFTLMHELAHVVLHRSTEVNHFIDDLDIPSSDIQYELEADDMANEALIPKEEWVISPARVLSTPDAANHLANRLEIHPAIVAGKMQFMAKSYRILNNMVGRGIVRSQFKNTGWD
ncbi:ImmA/IrrE family metallo-endopeptidase [Candidatus Neomarinimicrobiota bacterium]